jgi:hypothetical protein
MGYTSTGITTEEKPFHITGNGTHLLLNTVCYFVLKGKINVLRIGIFCGLQPGHTFYARPHESLW